MSIFEQSAAVGGQADHEFDKGRRPLLSLLWSLLRLYWTGNKKKQAWLLLSLVISFVLLVAGIDAYKTYLTKWVMNALESKHQQEIYRILFIAVISLILSTPLVVYRDYTTRYLQYAWRRWFNLELLRDFFTHQSYYKLYLYSNIDNPDQRLAEDLDQFVQQSTVFFVELFFNLISLITFTAVLWTISPLLVLCAFAYAALGTSLVLLLTGQLVRVNFRNIKFQANYRYGLVHVRSNTEAIAFYRGEAQEYHILNEHFMRLIYNFKKLIGIERNISFISQSYILLSVLFSYYILVPSYLEGKIGIGSITQSVVVFGLVLSSLSIIVNKFKDLSTFAAVIRRLAGFVDALSFEPSIKNAIEYSPADHFELQDVTIQTPDYKQTLVKNLSITVDSGKGLLIMGPSGCGKSSILRTLARLWVAGDGKIMTPALNDTMFLPQQAYLILGSLREQLLYPNVDKNLSEKRLTQALESVNLGNLPQRSGGFDKMLDWSEILSLGEQQRLAIARLLLAEPKYAILDEATSALDEGNQQRAYQHILNSKMTYISVGHRTTLVDYHDYVLLLDEQDGWQFYSVKEYKKAIK